MAFAKPATRVAGQAYNSGHGNANVISCFMPPRSGRSSAVILVLEFAMVCPVLDLRSIDPKRPVEFGWDPQGQDWSL